MSNKSRIMAVTEQIKANNVVIGQMKTKIENLAQVTATAADVATGKVFVLPTGAVATGTRGPEGAMLTAIAITTPPTKLVYTAGDAFDPAGMVVTATYSNGATRVVAGCTYTPAALVAGGNVTVSFTEFGVTQTAVVAVTVAQVYVPQSCGAGLGLVKTAMLNNDGTLDADEGAILSKLKAGFVIQGKISNYLIPSGFVLATFFADALAKPECNQVSEMIDGLRTHFITQFDTYGSFEALFTNPAAKDVFTGIALTEVSRCAIACHCNFATDIANFTFTLCDKNSGNRRSGSIYELFFDAKLV